jgi:hypothetical protein
MRVVHCFRSIAHHASRCLLSALTDLSACRAGETQATGNARCDFFAHGRAMRSTVFRLVNLWCFSGLYILAHQLPQPPLEQQLSSPDPPLFDADCVIGRIVYNRCCLCQPLNSLLEMLTRCRLSLGVILNTIWLSTCRVRCPSLPLGKRLVTEAAATYLACFTLTIIQLPIQRVAELSKLSGLVC